jgi:hypothetical protein
MEGKRNESFSEVIVGTVDITLKKSHGRIITPSIKVKNLFQDSVSNLENYGGPQDILVGRSICCAKLVLPVHQPVQRSVSGLWWPWWLWSAMVPRLQATTLQSSAASLR